jgi:hypothetical protein
MLEKNALNAYARSVSTVCRLSFVAFVSNLNAESIIDTWNVPAKTKMESNKRREGMYNIIDFVRKKCSKRVVVCIVCARKQWTPSVR